MRCWLFNQTLLLNRILCFDHTIYFLFQVDPSKHRMLLEVFDENRLVSDLFMLKLYNLYYSDKLGTVFLLNCSSSFFPLQNLFKCVFMFTESKWKASFFYTLSTECTGKTNIHYVWRCCKKVDNLLHLNMTNISFFII